MSAITTRLRQSMPPPSRHFGWMRQAASGQLSVFVPVLLGAGMLLSAAAWAVEWIGRLTGGSAVESGLARRMEALALPPEGLMGDGRPDPFSPRRNGRQG